MATRGVRIEKDERSDKIVTELKVAALLSNKRNVCWWKKDLKYYTNNRKLVYN
jgi:hypothetical protein